MDKEKKGFWYGLHKGSRTYKQVMLGGVVIFIGTVIFFLLAKSEALKETIFIFWSSITGGLFGGAPVAQRFSKGSTILAQAKADREKLLEDVAELEPVQDSVQDPVQKKGKVDGVVTLRRFKSMTDRTAGHLEVEGLNTLCSLEDAVREEKIKGVTAIPAGKYPLRIRKDLTPKTRRYLDRFTWFQRFIEICEIPDFSHVYIHIGNTPEDSLGCPLVAYGFAPNYDLTGTSVKAMRYLYEYLYPKLEAGEQWQINIINEFE
jgi:hypothetical protein